MGCISEIQQAQISFYQRFAFLNNYHFQHNQYWSAIPIKYSPFELRYNFVGERDETTNMAEIQSVLFK